MIYSIHKDLLNFIILGAVFNGKNVLIITSDASEYLKEYDELNKITQGFNRLRILPSNKNASKSKNFIILETFSVSFDVIIIDKVEFDEKSEELVSVYAALKINGKLIKVKDIEVIE